MGAALAVDSGWPIKYRWQGTFRYPLETDGHQWLYDDRASFKIWRLRSRTPEKFKEGPQQLSRVARKILLKNVFDKIPQPYGDSNLFPFARWLANQETSQHVKRGLSVVLNSIVLDATLKPFRIVTTFVNSSVTVHVQGLKPLEPQWFFIQDPAFPYLLEEYMLIQPSMFFETPENDADLVPKTEDEFNAAAKQFKYTRVLHKYTVTDFHVGNDAIKLSLNDTVTICRYEKGRLCGCIPVPGEARSKGVEPEDVLSPEVVVESPVVSKTLTELSRIWQDRNTKKSVLISAPPGSGKEVFCSGIVYGNGRRVENFQSLSLASDDQKGLERLLFGDENGGVLRAGLIEKAAKSGLFLDEVHQPERGPTGNNSSVRSALLRPLEARTFIPKGSSTVTKVNDVLFIMATSKSREQLKHFNPPDFWTRMTHFVTIPHPLAIFTKDGIRDDSKIDEVLACFFNFFWWERVENFYESKRGEDKNVHSYSEKLLSWQKAALHAVVEKGWISETIGENAVKNIDKSQPAPGVEFAAVLRRVLKDKQPKELQPYECSIRGIRNMVCRLFYIAATRVAQGEEVLLLPQEFRDAAERIAIEIVPIADISENPAPMNYNI
jgi:hypothetical protein